MEVLILLVVFLFATKSLHESISNNKIQGKILWGIVLSLELIYIASKIDWSKL